MVEKGTPWEERFWTKVDRRGVYECWEWTGGRTGNGYGALDIDGKMRTVHRLSFGIHYGDIPDGLCVLHHCDNPPCVNPQHLFAGTVSDNAVDMIRKGRGNRPFGERHHSAKLTDAQVLEILLIKPVSGYQSTIARKFGVSQVTISDIRSRKTWKHLDAAGGSTQQTSVV